MASSVSPDTEASQPAGHEKITSTLPELQYSLHTRKVSIGIYWALQFLTSSILVITLYFGLKYGAGIEERIGRCFHSISPQYLT
jgi:hypothetical protein